MCWVEVDGKEIPWEEYDKIQQAKLDKKYQELWEHKQQAYKLFGELGQAFRALSQLLEDHPELDLKFDLKSLTEGAVDQKVYELLKQRLGLADEAPRCMHVKADGIRCGSPRMKDGELCFAHQRMAQAQTLQQRLGAIEDANGVQMALSAVLQAANADKITEKKARLLLYGLRTAMANAKNVTFGKSPKQMVTEETPVSARQKEDAPKPEPLLFSPDERYRFENVDPDLQLEFNEWCAKVDRRWIDKQKALTNGEETYHGDTEARRHGEDLAVLATG